MNIGYLEGLNMRKIKIISVLSAILIVFTTAIPTTMAQDVLEDTYLQYEMSFELDEDTKTLIGHQKVKFENSYNTSLAELVFHLYAKAYNSHETLPTIGEKMITDENRRLSEEEIGDIIIHKVMIDGKDVNFSEGNQVLKIPLDAPLVKGEEINIDIDFTLKIPEGTHRFGHYDGVYSLTNWYPILSIYDEEKRAWDENPYYPIGESNYSDVADYKIIAKLPIDMVVASTGKVIEENSQDSFKIVEIEAKTVRDFALFFSRDYKVIESSVDGIILRNFYLPEKPQIQEMSFRNESIDKRQDAKLVLDFATESVRFYNRTFGKYPYEKIDIAETPLSGGAMEYPQAIQMGQYFEIDISPEDDWIPWIIEAVVHEIAHQWWYVTVGSNEFKEPFLDEAFATYSAALFFEKKYGKYSPQGAFMLTRTNIITEELPALRSSVEAFENWFEYSRTIYGRGPILLEDLRDRVGEDKFFEIIRAYYERLKFKNATIDDFLEIIEETTDKSTRQHIENALNRRDYFPRHLLLEEEDYLDVQKYRHRKRISYWEKERGITIGSFVLRVIDGCDITIVLPETMSDREGKVVNTYKDSVIQSLERLSEKNINILRENQMTEEREKDTLLILCDPSKSKIFSHLQGSLPFTVHKDVYIIGDIQIHNENVTGLLIAENPGNPENVILFLLYNEKSKDEDILDLEPIWNNDMQFKIDVGGRKTIKGLY